MPSSLRSFFARLGAFLPGRLAHTATTTAPGIQIQMLPLPATVANPSPASPVTIRRLDYIIGMIYLMILFMMGMFFFALTTTRRRLDNKIETLTAMVMAIRNGVAVGK